MGQGCSGSHRTATAHAAQATARSWPCPQLDLGSDQGCGQLEDILVGVGERLDLERWDRPRLRGAGLQTMRQGGPTVSLIRLSSVRYRGQRRCSTLVSNPGAALGGKHAREGRKATLPIAPAVLTGPIPLDPEGARWREGGSLGSSGWLSPDSVQVVPTGRTEGDVRPVRLSGSHGGADRAVQVPPLGARSRAPRI
jgi:hypothetical protein